MIAPQIEAEECQPLPLVEDSIGKPSAGTNRSVVILSSGVADEDSKNVVGDVGGVVNFVVSFFVGDVVGEIVGEVVGDAVDEVVGIVVDGANEELNGSNVVVDKLTNFNPPILTVVVFTVVTGSTSSTLSSVS